MDGGDGGGLGTTTVAAESAAWLRAKPFSTVSATTNVWPTSLGVMLRVCLVALDIAEHSLPEAEQRIHCQWGLDGALLHVPSTAVNVWPCSTAPLIVGGDTFVGAEGVAIWSASEVDTSHPPGFVARSCTSIHSPTSSAPGT